MSIAKGHRYVSVFVDMENHNVLFAADGKDAQVFEQFTEELYLKNGHPHAITEVSMDMSPLIKVALIQICVMRVKFLTISTLRKI